jgi:hypothetical protein
MEVDLTVVLTAAVTGLAGYGGARLQGRVALAQSRAQTAQAKAERDHTALEKRQGAYHDLLDVIRALQGQVYDSNPMTPGDLTTWNNTYQHLLNGVQLVGVESVRLTAQGFDDVIQSLSGRLPANPPSFQIAIQTAYEQSEAEITKSFRELINAMSADVAPAQPAPAPIPSRWHRLTRLGRIDP